MTDNDEKTRALQSIVGKTIATVRLERIEEMDDRILVRFTDGTAIQFTSTGYWDDTAGIDIDTSAGGPNN